MLAPHDTTAPISANHPLEQTLWCNAGWLGTRCHHGELETSEVPAAVAEEQVLHSAVTPQPPTLEWAGKGDGNIECHNPPFLLWGA